MAEPSKNPEGSHGIFIRDLSAGTTVQVTPGKLTVDEPTEVCGFSGDGLTVLYRQVVGGSSVMKLASLNAGGTAVASTMTINNASLCSSNRQLSSNGRYILFETDISIDSSDPSGMDVYLYDTVGSSYTWLSQNVGARGSFSSPFFSADGARALFTCTQNAATLWGVALSNIAGGATPLYVPQDSIPPYGPLLDRAVTPCTITDSRFFGGLFSV
jgi:Tol biopolymer transport system component